MARLRDRDIMDINKWFDEALNRLSKVDRKKKMRMRRKVRDEVYFLLTWQKPTPSMILNRWEEKMSDVFGHAIWIKR